MSPANLLQLSVQRDRVFISHIPTRLQQRRLILRQLPTVIDKNTKILLLTLRVFLKPHRPRLLWIL